MSIVTTTEMFKKAYEGGYAVGAFNINNMEIIQAITEAAAEDRSPVILQVSAGARKYAKPAYLMALAKAAVADQNIPLRKILRLQKKLSIMHMHTVSS